jgi:hypothetical protein
MRVYIESTIPSYLAARRPRDARQASRQATTQRWWDRERAKHELFVSAAVLEEISRGEAQMAEKRLALVHGIPKLDMVSVAEEIASRALQSGALPRDAETDAAHIGPATAHAMDILLTWNCRHLSNPSIQRKLREIAARYAVTLPLICTPEQLMRTADEQQKDRERSVIQER